jgi:hypothetical protein
LTPTSRNFACQNSLTPRWIGRPGPVPGGERIGVVVVARPMFSSRSLAGLTPNSPPRLRSTVAASDAILGECRRRHPVSGPSQRDLPSA